MERQGNTVKLVAVCALLAGLCSTVSARIIYVDDDAAGANDGSSWSDAFVWLQEALVVAEPGDEVRVAQGLYMPDLGGPPVQVPRGRWRGGSTGPTEPQDPLGSPYAVFDLKSGVAVVGGFAGLTGDVPDDRDVQQYPTVLTGDLKGNDSDVWDPWHPVRRALQSDNSLHIVNGSDTDSTAVLDGFIMTGAVDFALYMRKGSPTIRDCTFRRNRGRSGGALGCLGGHPVVSACTFEQNASWGYGAAIHASHYAGVGALNLTDCRFVDNVAMDGGGAIYVRQSHLAATNCVFERNAATFGGGIAQDWGSLDLVGCRFEGNLAAEGGAFWVVDSHSVAVTDCEFVTNRAVDRGGAIYKVTGHTVLDSSVTFDGCTFTGNAATHGGALYATAHLRREVFSIANGLFTGNRAHESGGAIYGDYLPFTAVNCTFAGNQAARGAGIDWRYDLWMSGDPTAVVISNCILWDGPESVIREFEGAKDQTFDAADAIAITYSDVQGGWPGEGNIDADPLFATPGWWADPTDLSTPVEPDFTDAVWVEGDYHVRSEAGRWAPALEVWVEDEVTSPCIDAGDPETPVSGEPEPNGSRINMGVYGGTAEASKSP